MFKFGDQVKVKNGANESSDEVANFLGDTVGTVLDRQVHSSNPERMLYTIAFKKNGLVLQKYLTEEELEPSLNAIKEDDDIGTFGHTDA